MTAYSTLRTRLYNRLGISTASTAEAALCDEALNAGFQKVVTEGAPQLRQVYTGYTVAAAAPSVTHTANSSTVTLSSVAGIYPGDILNNATTGRKYIIRSVVPSPTNTVNIGIAEVTSMTGNTCTVTRRTLPLPHAGTVWEIREINGAKLTEDSTAASRFQFETGSPVAYTQAYGEESGTSYVSLFPAPDTVKQYLVIQGPGLAEDPDIYASEAVLQSILSFAYEYRMMMSAQGGMAGMGANMAQSLVGLRSKSSAGTGVVTR